MAEPHGSECRIDQRARWRFGVFGNHLMELAPPTLVLFCATLAFVVVLYASVGQAGASGFVAVMSLFGFVPEVIKPTSRTPVTRNQHTSEHNARRAG